MSLHILAGSKENEKSEKTKSGEKSVGSNKDTGI
jgi:hypothetical protein